MIFGIYGKSNGMLGRQYLQFQIENTTYIAVRYEEAYEVRLFNSFMHPIEVSLVDGGGNLLNQGGEAQRFVVSHQTWLRVDKRVYDENEIPLVFGEVGWPDKNVSAGVYIETDRPEKWVDGPREVRVVKPKFHKRFTICCMEDVQLMRLLQTYSDTPINFGGPEAEVAHSSRVGRKYSPVDRVNQVQITNPWRFTGQLVL